MPKPSKTNKYLTMPMAILTAFAVVSTSLLATMGLSSVLTGQLQWWQQPWGSSSVPRVSPNSSSRASSSAQSSAPPCALYVRGANIEVISTAGIRINLYEKRISPSNSPWNNVDSEVSSLSYPAKAHKSYRALCGENPGATPSNMENIEFADLAIMGVTMDNPTYFVVNVENVGEIAPRNLGDGVFLSIEYKAPNGASKTARTSFAYHAINEGQSTYVIVPTAVDDGYGVYRSVTVELKTGNLLIESPVDEPPAPDNNKYGPVDIEVRRQTSSSPSSGGGGISSQTTSLSSPTPSSTGNSSSSSCGNNKQCFAWVRSMTTGQYGCVSVWVMTMGSCTQYGLADSMSACAPRSSSAPACNVSVTKNGVTTVIP